MTRSMMLCAPRLPANGRVGPGLTDRLRARRRNSDPGDWQHLPRRAAY